MKIKGFQWIVLCVVIMFASFAAAEEITIVGTGGGVAILEAVASAFTQAHPEVSVHVPKSIGSGGGIKAVGRDEQVLGRVARPIKEKEAHFGLTHVPIAKMPIVFFTHKSAGITNLSAQQVLDIYSGKITNWKDVGGQNARIRVVRREDGDSSLSVLEKSFPGFKDITITERSKTVFSDPDTLSIVEKKAGTIAFGTYGNAAGHALNILNIDNISPSDKKYAYFGTLALIFKEKNREGNAAAFIKFATSETAHEPIKNAGGLPF